MLRLCFADNLTTKRSNILIFSIESSWFEQKLQTKKNLKENYLKNWLTFLTPTNMTLKDL